MSASLRLAGVRSEVRSLSPPLPSLSLSRDRKESPFPGPNELPSFPRGGILHGARLDGRRAGRRAEGKTEKCGERARWKFRDRVCPDFSRIFHIQPARPSLAPLYLFFRVFVSSAARVVRRTWRSFSPAVSLACFVVDCVKRFHGDCQTDAIRPFPNRTVIFNPWNAAARFSHSNANTWNI